MLSPAVAEAGSWLGEQQLSRVAQILCAVGRMAPPQTWILTLCTVWVNMSWGILQWEGQEDFVVLSWCSTSRCASHVEHSAHHLWLQVLEVLCSNYTCHSSDFGVCCILDYTVFSSSIGHLPGRSLAPSSPKEQSLSSQCDYSPFHSIIGFFYYSLRHVNQILLSTKIFVLQRMLASSAVEE